LQLTSFGRPSAPLALTAERLYVGRTISPTPKCHEFDDPIEINNWNIDFDPHGYAVDDKWAGSVLPAEDILQLSHVYLDLIIDVGCYSGSFVVFVVKAGDWGHPIERLEVGDLGDLNREVNRLVVKYVN
jgi:hypothetical protein